LSCQSRSFWVTDFCCKSVSFFGKKGNGRPGDLELGFKKETCSLVNVVKVTPRERLLLFSYTYVNLDWEEQNNTRKDRMRNYFLSRLECTALLLLSDKTRSTTCLLKRPREEDREWGQESKRNCFAATSLDHPRKTCCIPFQSSSFSRKRFHFISNQIIRASSSLVSQLK